VVSVDGLLDAHEVAVRLRVEGLREQAGRVAAELAEAELALEHVTITRATLAVVLASDGGAGVSACDGPVAVPAGSGRELLPLWRAGLTGADLPVGYRPVWQVVVDAAGPLRAGQVAVLLGLEATSTKVEGLRYRLKRLVARGWIGELASGAFIAAASGSVVPVGGS
jgi:hypothetical protein